MSVEVVEGTVGGTLILDATTTAAIQQQTTPLGEGTLGTVEPEDKEEFLLAGGGEKQPPPGHVRYPRCKVLGYPRINPTVLVVVLPNGLPKVLASTFLFSKW